MRRIRRHGPRARERTRPSAGRLHRSPLFYGLLLGVLLAGTAARAEVRVNASLDQETVQVGGRAVLTVTVEGAVSLDQGPALPEPQGLIVRSAGQSTNISIVNGRMSRQISFQYVLVPQKPGTYALGPVEIRDGGKLYRSAAVTLTAVAGSTGGGPGSAPAVPPGAPGRSAPGQEEPLSAEDGGNDLFVRTEVDRDHVYVGEQITLRFQFYQRMGVPLLEAPQYTPPGIEGFWREDLPPQRTGTRTVRGAPYSLTELVYALFPTQSGRLEIGPGTLECAVRDTRGRGFDPFGFFGGIGSRPVRLKSRPIPIRVDPLPEPRPPDFTGGVGHYTLRASVDRNEAVQNEPVTLTLAVEGRGNVSTVGDPTLPPVPGIRVYPSGSQVTSSKDNDVLGGRKSFNLMLVSENTGRKEIPSVRLSVFDPDSKRYVRLESQPLAIQILPARGTGTTATGGDVARIGRDLRTIRGITHLARIGDEVPWRHAGFWIWLGVPVVLLGLAWGYRRRQEARASNWGLFLSRGASGRFRRDLEALGKGSGLAPADGFARLDALLERFLTDRFGFPVRGRTREELRTRLREEGISEEGLSQAMQVLERCDFARFAPQAQTAEDLRHTLQAASRLPEILVLRGPAGSPSPPGGGTTRLGLFLWTVLVLAGVSAAGAPVWGQGSGQGAGPGLGLVPATSAPDPATDVDGQAAVLSKRAPRTRQEALAAFQRGNEAYGRSDNSGAVREYSQVLAGDFESPDLLLNLGNACYRAGRLGWAIYFFERGRRLDPTDPDLKANLELAMQETKDRVPESSSSRLLQGLVTLQDRTSLAGGLRWFTFFWWMFLLYAALRLTWPGDRLSARGGSRLRTAGLVLGAALALSAGWTAMKAYQRATAPDAVVIAEDLPVRSNPDPEATVEFSLHAGTRVRLGRELYGFREVLFSEKLRGWGAQEALARLGEKGPEVAAGLGSF